MKDIVYVFWDFDTDFIVYMRSTMKEYKDMIKCFRETFRDVKMEIIHPKEVFIEKPDKYSFNSDRGGIFFERRKFNLFKRNILRIFVESTEENLPPMPEWARKSKELGSNIVFVDGVWKIRFS